MVTLQQLDPIYVDFPVARAVACARSPSARRRSMTLDAFPGQTFDGKIAAIDARVSQDTRNVARARRIRQPRPQAVAGHVRQCRRSTTGAPADVLTVPRTAIVYQPLRRQRLCREAGAARRRARRRRATKDGQAGPHRRAALRAGRRDARRARGDRGGRRARASRSSPPARSSCSRTRPSSIDDGGRASAARRNAASRERMRS